MNCAFCPHHKCYTEGQNCTKYSHEEVCGFYSEDDRRMMRASSATESRNYMKMTRLEESAFFAKELGVKKIGIAFCIGLANEAHFCAQYFKNQGFAVESVCCKVCSVDKDMLELEKIKPGKHEAMCNPRTQAQLLNSAGTELNFIVGMICSLPWPAKRRYRALLPKTACLPTTRQGRCTAVTGGASLEF